MDLNKIELTGEIIEGLYKNVMVEISLSDKTGEKATNQPVGGIKFLGENKKNILVMVNYPIAGYLPDEQLNFLSAILNACKVSLADVAIVNQHNSPTMEFEKLAMQFMPKTILLFSIDLNLLQLHFRFPPFQVQQLNNCTYLLSPSLEDLSTDKDLKSKLWNCLQRIFLS